MNEAAAILKRSGSEGSGNMTRRDPIRVIVVDDQQIVRSGLASMLAPFDDIALVSSFAGAEETLDWDGWADGGADVALVDARMPGIDGPELIARLRRLHPEIRCILLTAFDENGNLMAAIQAGAYGHLLKDVSMDDLADAIREVAAGGRVLGGAATSRVMDWLTDGMPPVAPVEATETARDKGLRTTQDDASHGSCDAAALLERLSPRDRQIASLVAEGHTNAEIARTMFLSTGTVKNHITAIFQTLCVRNRTELTALLR